METIGDRLKYYRQRKNMTQAEVAEKLGIQKPNYQKYESGQRNPKDDRIKEMAQIFGCGFLSIKYGEKDMFIARANDSIRRAIMGEDLVYTSIADDWGYEDWEEGSLTTEITTFFSDYALELEEINPDFYKQYIEVPALQNIFELADKFHYAVWHRLVEPDDYQDDFEEYEDDAITPTQWYGIAFSYLVIDYFSGIESDQQVIDDTKAALDDDSVTDEDAGLQFASKIFTPFLHYVIEAVSAMYEEGGTFEERYLENTR